MKRVAFILLFIPFLSKSQDSLFIYTKIFSFDSLSKNHIYDKASVWCGRRFNDSKSAIRFSAKESGIISGKAYYMNIYKIPKKKDSTIGTLYNRTYFNWIIEIKDNKLRFTADEMEFECSDVKYPITYKVKPPFEIWLQPVSKTKMEWFCAKKYLYDSLESILEELQQTIAKKEEEW